MRSVILLTLGALALSGCYDGVSCDMDPEQRGCPEEDANGNTPPRPTPTPDALLVAKASGFDAFEGKKASVVVVYPGHGYIWCGGDVVTNGRIVVTSDSPIVAGGYGYNLWWIFNADEDAQYDAGTDDISFLQAITATSSMTAIALDETMDETPVEIAEGLGCE